jgi:hypothetical protein
MSAHAKKGFLPEGGEMLILGVVLFVGTVGIILLMLSLSPGFSWSEFFN